MFCQIAAIQSPVAWLVCTCKTAEVIGFAAGNLFLIQIDSFAATMATSRHFDDAR